MIVLSNAGPLIALSKLNRLTLLSELYGTVLVPRTVEGEVVTAQGRPDALTARLFLQHYRWPILEAAPEVLGDYQAPGAGSLRGVVEPSARRAGRAVLGRVEPVSRRLSRSRPATSVAATGEPGKKDLSRLVVLGFGRAQCREDPRIPRSSGESPFCSIRRLIAAHLREARRMAAGAAAAARRRDRLASQLAGHKKAPLDGLVRMQRSGAVVSHRQQQVRGRGPSAARPVPRHRSGRWLQGLQEPGSGGQRLGY